MKIIKINTGKTKKILVMATFSVVALFSLSQNSYAQRVQDKVGGGRAGTKYDLYVVNNDHSNHDSGVRLQSNDNGYFLWQRYADSKFRITYGGNGADGNMDDDLFELDRHGDVRFRGSIANLNGGTLTVNDALSVKGAITLTGNIVDSNGSVTIQDGLTVTGSINDSNSDVKIADGLIVTGNISDDGGDVTIHDGLNITGNIYDSNSDVKIADGLIVTGNISDDTGNVTINDGLTITGNINDSNSDVTIADGLNVTGNLYDSNSDLIVNDGMVVNNNFQTKGTSTFNNKLTVTSNGLTVTGTSTFSTGLTVTGGNIVADAVTLNVGSFPDYVFEHDYELMPLTEVEAHINQYKRLPKMPSEVEVLENGMDAGKVNVLLVEKVEELTLHTIAQEKEIEKLKVALVEVLQKLDK